MEMDLTLRCSRCDSRKLPSEFPPSKVTNKGQWCRQCLREDARRRLDLRATDREVICRHCGSAFVTSYVKAMFCSLACKDRARKAACIQARSPVCLVWHRHAAVNASRRQVLLVELQRRRPPHHANWRRRSGERAPLRPRKDPLPSFIDIAERDRWRCGICGKPVNKRLNFPDPLAGSLDHLLPVSCGGSHHRTSSSSTSGATGRRAQRQ